MLIRINNKKIEADICKSLLSKAIGFMFSFKPRNLLFIFDKETVHSLHMFFVFFPIDVVFLEKNKKIVEIKEDFMPFTFYKPINKAMYILEMARGSVKRYGIKHNVKIEFKIND